MDSRPEIREALSRRVAEAFDCRFRNQRRGCPVLRVLREGQVPECKAEAPSSNLRGPRFEA
jgi:hypothetical protein